MPVLSLISERFGEMGVTTATSLWLFFFGELIFIKLEISFLVRNCRKTLALVVQFKIYFSDQDKLKRLKERL